MTDTNHNSLPCPCTAELQHLIEGRLDESQQTLIVRHLDDCTCCQKRLEGLAEGEAALCELVQHIDRDRPDAKSAFWPAVERLRDGLAEHDGSASRDGRSARDGLGETVIPERTPTPVSAANADDLDLSFLDPPSDPAYLGRIGHFEISRVIGHGGMGIVLEAYDSHLQRTVAVKVLAPELAGDEVARQRFCREARASASITHEHVVSVHQVEKAGANGIPYLVMQLIQGETLEKRLARDGKLPLNTILRIGMQTAAGLAAAHAEGLIHRDVKPGNILLEQSTGRVKLTDFGLARCIEDVKITRTGFVTGTPLYMSPEQALGAEIDERADLFSLGGVLYEMATGEPPFSGNTPLAVLRQITDSHARPARNINPEIPGWLNDLIQQLLAKRPDQRPISATVVAQILADRLSTMEPVSPLQVPAVHTSGACQTAKRQHARNRLMFLVAGVITGSILALGLAIPLLGLRPSAATVASAPVGSAAVATLAGNSGPVWSVGFSPDGRTLAMAIDDGTVKLWDVDTQRLLSTLSVHQGPVWATSISASGQFLATGHDDGMVHVWRLSDESKVNSFSAGGPVRSLDFSPKGSLLAIGTRTGQVTIWNADDAKTVVTTEGHAGVVMSVAFSPDGTQLGSAGGDKTARIWNVETGRERLRLEGHNGAIYSLAFSADGGMVATGGWDHKVRLWNTASGSLEGELNGSDADIWSVSFAPEGHILAAVGEDRVVHLWDASTEAVLPIRTGHTGTLYTSAFSSRGELATAGRDGTARIWKMDPAAGSK